VAPYAVRNNPSDRYGPTTVGKPVLVELPETCATGCDCSQRMKNCKFAVLPV
jgi:hypothetical protein